MERDFLDRLTQRLGRPLPGGDAHRKVRPQLASGKQIRFNNPSKPREGAVLILLFENENRLYFPLIQRPVYDGIHSGQIALPGGRREPEDQNLIFTALRESREEIGIEIKKVKILGQLSPLVVAASNHEVLPVIGYYPEVPVFIPEEKEVDEVFSVTLDDLMDEATLKRTTIEVANGYKLDSPYYDLHDKIVWGATAGILSEFIHVLEDL